MSNPSAPQPIGPDADVARRVDPNAKPLFQRPLLVILVLAGVGGMLDADDYLTYGVFTANQAGNMVLLWIKLLESPGVALLSLSSMIGCAVGISSVVLIRSLKWWPIGNRGSRLLLFTAAAVLAVTSIVGGRVFDPRAELSAKNLELGSSDWWGAMVSISLSAFSLGLLATIFVWAGVHKTAVIAATGPYLDAARYAAASARYKVPEYKTKWRTLVAFPIAWSIGAMVVGLSSLDRPVITLIAVVTITATGILARRVETDEAPTAP
jgi:uncharacterized membrane protein YoaK (UPF0700 family)